MIILYFRCIFLRVCRNFSYRTSNVFFQVLRYVQKHQLVATFISGADVRETFSPPLNKVSKASRPPPPVPSSSEPAFFHFWRSASQKSRSCESVSGISAHCVLLGLRANFLMFLFCYCFISSRFSKTFVFPRKGINV